MKPLLCILALGFAFVGVAHFAALALVANQLAQHTAPYKPLAYGPLVCVSGEQGNAPCTLLKRSIVP